MALKQSAGIIDPDEGEIEVDEVPRGANMLLLLRENISTLVKAVELDDKNLIRRVWRRNTPIRRDLSLTEFQEVLNESFPKGERLNLLLGYTDQAMVSLESKFHTKDKVSNPKSKASKTPKEEPLMEVEAYLVLFIISALIKSNELDSALTACKDLLNRFQALKRQTLDTFVSKTFSFYSLASERLHQQSAQIDSQSHYAVTLLEDLLVGQKMSSLRLYEQCQASLINLILRRYIKENLYSQARMFLNSTIEARVTDSVDVSNNEQTRYLYYAGKIAAVEANYSDSDASLAKAIRKCPSNTGFGFRLAITKLIVVTKLLMGEVPDRSVFYEGQMTNEMQPYFHLVKSFRLGSVAEYDKIAKSFKQIFERDDLMTLIERLRSSVIRTGLRNINLSYSRINFSDITTKLELKSEADAELVCAKAIRDSIIENAILDSVSKCLISTETIDVYSTTLEPKSQFNNRANFCLGIHNSAVKAHKYPPNSHKALKTAKKSDNQEPSEEDLMDAMEDLME